MSQFAKEINRQVGLPAQRKASMGRSMPATPQSLQMKRYGDLLQQKRDAMNPVQRKASGGGGGLPGQLRATNTAMVSTTAPAIKTGTMNSSFSEKEDAEMESNSSRMRSNSSIAVAQTPQRGPQDPKGAIVDAVTHGAEMVGPMGAIGGGVLGAAFMGLANGVTQAGASYLQKSAQAPTVTGLVVPKDNFAGRSKTRYGAAEIVDLSMKSTSTPAALGGLKWSIKSGGGTLTAATTAGTATYTCPDGPATVVLELKVQAGAKAGTVAATKTLIVVPPNNALMAKDGRAIRHTLNSFSVGFYGQIFLRPMDVSFTNIFFREGSVAAVASGYLGGDNGEIHPLGGPISVASGNSANGNQVNGIDNVSRNGGGPPFAIGDFLWPIPWQYQVPGGAWKTFTTANHHLTANAAGTATISKKGEGPHSKAIGDPTVVN